MADSFIRDLSFFELQRMAIDFHYRRSTAQHGEGYQVYANRHPVYLDGQPIILEANTPNRAKALFQTWLRNNRRGKLTIDFGK